MKYLAIGLTFGTVLIILSAAEVLAQEKTDSPDIVVLSEATGTRKLRGHILDYTGDGLQIVLPGGREKMIPPDQIVDVRLGDPSTAQRGARLAIEAGQFEKALSIYYKLLSSGAETRAWVQRDIRAEMIECQRALEQYDQAATSFIRLLEDDPKTPYFSSIPLVWLGGVPFAPKTLEDAKLWLSSRQPTARLLGASFLLTSPDRERATEELMQLRENPDTTLSNLATAQWLRTRILKASPKDIRRCQKAIEGLPVQLRSGPYYVLGQLYAARKEHRQAASAMMHVPILFPKQQRLAAESLLTAGKSMGKSGLHNEAVRMYQEIISNYPKSIAASEAKQRLQELVNQSKES